MDSIIIDKHESELLYVIPVEMNTRDKLQTLLCEHPEVKFASLVGIDLRGNDTDEKIPIRVLFDSFDEFIEAGVQTDGSSVVLPGIASLNDGKVDLIADTSVRWHVDHNYEHIDSATGRPVGTLRIPSFLLHGGRMVDSRSVLKKAVDHFSEKIKELFERYPEAAKQFGIKAEDIKDVRLMAATELEFWVKTPNDKAVVEELVASQVLQEQYWKRTKGVVRTALEKSLLLLERYGLSPEMGHKEVGGVKARLNGEGQLDHIMEQLEVDWKYDTALQAADNELLARILIKETFRRHGLEVTFMAKPIEGVNGSGEHTHVSVVVELKNGKKVNLFTPRDMKKDFLSPIGWGALMGLLKNYEVVNPFITSTNDAFNRLKPGFEAPVSIVASLGHSVEMPSRNRTVLVGLIRSMDNPMSVRFEIRSPNPHTNTYLALAAIYQSMLDGIEYAVKSGKAASQLEKEFSKAPDEPADYLEKGRAYRSEEDVFEHFTQEKRNEFFGVPPRTVWENLRNLDKYPGKRAILEKGDVFNSVIINSFVKAASLQWLMELSERIIAEGHELVRSCVKCHGSGYTDYDEKLWLKIDGLRKYLAKDSLSSKSLFTRIKELIERHDYDAVSRLQLEMAEKIEELKKLYSLYKRNQLD